MLSIFCDCLLKALTRRKCRICSILACLMASGILYLVIDFLNLSNSNKKHRQNRIHSYFVNISRFAHITTDHETYGEENKGPTPCKLPELSLWTPEVTKYVKKPPRIECNDDENWVFTQNGKFYISSEAAKKHGRIHCVYIPIINTNDSYKELKPVVPMLNGSALVSDAFKVTCKSGSGKRYTNIHACIAPVKRQKFRRAKKDNFSIFIFGFDSLSRHMFMRLLPKTHDYFTNVLGGSILEGYNIVGDGTPQALMPLLTGKQETEIPEVRRGKTGARHVDDVLTFFWTRCERKGYVTQWGEDMAHVGTFNLRMLGFRKQPVHHYMRPFYLAAIPLYPYFRRNCLGSKPRHMVFLDWLKEGFRTNRNRKFFTFGFFSELSHDNNNPIALMDDDNRNFLELVDKEGFLDETILIMMSDHGIRYGPLRSTEQGKLEERLPYFGFRFPDKFKRKFPEKAKSFEQNVKRLVTPFDVHETLLDIIGEHSEDKTGVTRRGRSLFKDIPVNRTCGEAGIEPHWCTCLKQTNVPLTDKTVLTCSDSIVKTLNDMLKPFADLCHELKIDTIIKARKLETSDKVLKFRKTVDEDGRVLDMTDSLKASKIIYQLTFTTKPNNAMFEATVEMHTKAERCKVNEREISRINKYGDDPWCVLDKAPRLRPYCVCKDRKN